MVVLIKEKIIKQNKLFILGLIVLLSSFVAYCLLGENSIVTIHDNLDSDVLYYVLCARYRDLFSGDTYAGFMNGHAHISVSNSFEKIYYYLFSPVYAYIINLYVVRFIAYLGMYLLLKESKINNYISFIVSISFSVLPFYSVYGLSAMGIPFLLYAFSMLYKGKKILISFIYIILFGFYSSIVLIGFFLVLICIAVSVWSITKKLDRRFTLGFIVLVVSFLMANNHMIFGFFNDTHVSHRVEFKLEENNMLSSFFDSLLYGQYHAVSLHTFFWLAIFVFLIFLFLVYRLNLQFDKILVKKIVACIGLIVFISLFFMIFHSYFFIEIRNIVFSNSELRTFQFDRIYFLSPFLWFYLLGMLIAFICDSSKRIIDYYFSKYGDSLKADFFYKRSNWVFSSFAALVLFFSLFPVFVGSDIRWQIENLFNSDRYVSWGEFYNTDLYNQIEESIHKSKDDYYVASIGLYPSIASYNGFNCVDGYSNDYDIQYKHDFYNVIKDEIYTNTELNSYYLDWGSRCYLFSSLLGQDYLVDRGYYKYIKLNVDMDELKKLNCEYILSALPIDNFEELNLNYINVFDNGYGTYSVYLYEIE